MRHGLIGTHECPICHKFATTEHGLHNHMSQYHNEKRTRKHIKSTSLAFPAGFIDVINKATSDGGFSCRSRFVEHAIRAYIEYIGRLAAP